MDSTAENLPFFDGTIGDGRWLSGGWKRESWSEAGVCGVGAGTRPGSRLASGLFSGITPEGGPRAVVGRPVQPA